MEYVLALLALTLMEIVLGIDNIVFITIVSSKLPAEQQPLARKLGLALALLTRLALLVALFWFVHDDQFKKPIFELTDLGVPQSMVERMSVSTSDHGSELSSETLEEVNREAFKESNGVSIKDLILFLGGLFLLAKSIYEIHDEFSPDHETKATSSMFMWVLVQIALLDIVFFAGFRDHRGGDGRAA